MKYVGDGGLRPGVADSAPAESDASTRDLVARSILQHGPSTAGDLAKRLGLTTAAVRRHLGLLGDLGHIDSREQRVYGTRGRGRPAKVFMLTDSGRAEFYSAYDQLAISALEFLEQAGGTEAVERFAAEAVAGIEERFHEIRDSYPTPLDALVGALDEEGYVASLQPVASGQQLCQYHCPVAQVARRYPQLCEAETRVFAKLLDSHVQRIATIAHGETVCNTHVPRPVERTGHPHPSVRKGSI